MKVSDEDAVARFVERFALALTDAGMPRMPSRVFARLLVAEDAKCTAAELAESLKISPAAVSGAVRYLNQVGMASRGRDPGERRDHYELASDLWYEIYGQRDRQFDSWIAIIEEGTVAVGPDSAAGRRLDESRRFLEFLRKELPLLMERWRALNRE